jgi:hypothetical protein
MLVPTVASNRSSIVENAARAGGGLPCPSYDTLLRENERLRGSLVVAHEENDYLRQLYRGQQPWAGSERRNAA